MTFQPAQMPTAWSDMALIVISISDTTDGQVAVSMLAEPAMALDAQLADSTPAQLAALSMINVINSNSEQPVPVAMLGE